MEPFDLYPLVRQIVREELAQMLMGKVTATTADGRATARRFKDEPPIKNMRLIQPYGLASRPKPDTECVVAPINGDPSHLIVLGQNDKNRPGILQAGEVALYGPDGQLVHFKNGGATRMSSPGSTTVVAPTVVLGSDSADEPFVLGKVFKLWEQNLIEAVRAISYIGNLGAPVTGTLNDADFADLENQLEQLLSKKIFGEKGE
jgi:hypothetical protein